MTVPGGFSFGGRVTRTSFGQDAAWWCGWSYLGRILYFSRAGARRVSIAEGSK